MKIELKHWASYLSSKLKVYYAAYNRPPLQVYEVTGLSMRIDNRLLLTIKNIKGHKQQALATSCTPILYPLSEFKNYPDIMDEFSEYAFDQFENAFFIMGGCNNRFDFVDYTVMELMFKHHIDIFGLIDA